MDVAGKQECSAELMFKLFKFISKFDHPANGLVPLSSLPNVNASNVRAAKMLSKQAEIYANSQSISHNQLVNCHYRPLYAIDVMNEACK